ncbi:MAG: hypothetical protein KDC33_12170 [Thermoleophilia bacterium]|nr:hypothetical protein [Thermoleophilia bacterium]
MSDPFDPREALEAVQRLELDLDDVRARARRADPRFDALRAEIEARIIEDRARSVEDMGAVLDVVEAAWRAQQREHASLAADVHHLGVCLADARTEIAALRGMLAGARVEVRLMPAAAPTNGTPRANGHAGGVTPAG